MSAVDYTVDGKTYEGYFLRPKGKDVAPVVVIAHAWGGLGDNEREKAQRVSEMGYAAFAMDVYGKGMRGATVEECQALMNPLVEDRAELQKRLAGGLAAAKQQVGVDVIGHVIPATAARETGENLGGIGITTCLALLPSTVCSDRLKMCPLRKLRPKC